MSEIHRDRELEHLESMLYTYKVENKSMDTENERLKQEIRKLLAEKDKLRAALKPFATALKGNWSYQSDEMPIDAGFGASDLRLRFRLGDFRAARAAIGGDT